MIANEPDKKCRRNQSAQHEREEMSTNLRITRHKETHEHDAKGHEGVEMKERHRGIKRELNPKRERAGLSILTRAKIFFAPMPEQNQAGGNGVEQAALGHEHCQRNAFPGDVIDVLVIDEFEIA